MNWPNILNDAVILLAGIILGMLLWSLIRRHFREHDPFVPQIPHVRVGSLVMIGDDLYILKGYNYKERSSTADAERTAIFKSVPTHQREEIDV